MEIARQMLQQALKVKPGLLLSVVNEAVSSLPHFSQHAHLILHPSDAELVRGKMGEQLDHTGWKIFEDAQMERGGCRVETAHSQIDASLATRWKRVVSSIGQDSSWLEP
jgi:flagellar assembly protein FliH